MLMAMILRLFDRMCGVDRTEQLQHPNELWVPITEPFRSDPHVRQFHCRSDVIEQGAACHRRPRRLKLVNVESIISRHPGALRKINRLMRRGYYQAHR